MKAGRTPCVCTAGAALVVAYGCAAVAAEKAFSGDDAAYIDWAWKNCELVSTKKEHDLVELARNNGNDAFQRGYEQQYSRIVSANPGPADVKRTCEQIKGWYGTSGALIADLLQVKTDKPAVAGTSVGSNTSSSGKSGGRGGGGGRRGGGG